MDTRAIVREYNLNSLISVQFVIIIKHLFASGHFAWETHYNHDVHVSQYMVQYRAIY
jgi:hypothetical protein